MPDEIPPLAVGRLTGAVRTVELSLVPARRCWCGRPIRRPDAPECVEHDIVPALEQENP